MIPHDYETISVSRPSTRMEQGRIIESDPIMLGMLGMIVQPVSMDRQTDTGRSVTVTGYDLYLRGDTTIRPQVGDLIDVRGETLIITQTPAAWRRGDRVIGWHWHCERREDRHG